MGCCDIYCSICCNSYVDINFNGYYEEQFMKDKNISIKEFTDLVKKSKWIKKATMLLQ